MKRKRIIFILCTLIVISTLAPTTGSLMTEAPPGSLPSPQFEITFGEPILVKNIGDANATNVHVQRYFEGGFIILGKDKTVNLQTIAVGETKQAKMGWTLGLGRTTITVVVSCDKGVTQSGSHQGIIVLFFVILQ
jgi:hypothetical protein